MGKGRTSESSGALLTSNADLESQNQQLKQARKDLGRFLDVDKEKMELERLAKKIKEANEELAGVSHSIEDEKEKVRKKALVEREKIILNAQKEADTITEKAKTVLLKASDRVTEAERRESAVREERQKLAQAQEKMSRDMQTYGTQLAELKRFAHAMSKALEPILK